MGLDDGRRRGAGATTTRHASMRPDRGTAPRWLMTLGSRVAVAASSVGLERGARLIAIAITPLLLNEAERNAFGLLLIGLTLYVLLTGFAHRNRYLRGADLIVAGAVIVLTGTSLTAFLPFLLVAVAGPASQGGLPAGLAAGGTLSFVALVTIASTGELTSRGFGSSLTILLVLILTGVTTALASRMLDDRDIRGRRLLAEANRLLSSLRSITEELPGGLDVATVSAALVAEIRTEQVVRGVYVLAMRDGALHLTAASGAHVDTTSPIDGFDLLHRRARVVEARVLPADLAAAEIADVWLVLPLRDAGVTAGVALVGVDDAGQARQLRRRLATLSHDGAVAMQNAHLFDDTQQRAIDVARRRIASDLHDGVAQGLAHLRMELELLGRTGGEQDDDLRRLARVADRSLADLRNTISGLRAPAEADVGRLVERCVTDIGSRSGARISFRQHRHVVLHPGRAEEMMRVAQEAVSNALRHARASEILVTLDGDDLDAVLTVADDGVGVDASPPDPSSTGFGLHTMTERAARLGGSCVVSDRDPRGTQVRLCVPLVVGSTAGLDRGTVERTPVGHAAMAGAPGGSVSAAKPRMSGEGPR